MTQWMPQHGWSSFWNVRTVFRCDLWLVSLEGRIALVPGRSTGIQVRPTGGFFFCFFLDSSTQGRAAEWHTDRTETSSFFWWGLQDHRRFKPWVPCKLSLGTLPGFPGSLACLSSLAFHSNGDKWLTAQLAWPSCTSETWAFSECSFQWQKRHSLSLGVTRVQSGLKKT